MLWILKYGAFTMWQDWFGPWGLSLITTHGLPDHVRNWGWIVDAEEQLQI